MNKPLIVNPNTRLYGDLSRILKSAPKPLIDNGFIPSYAEFVFKSNSDFVQELNKIKAIAPNYQYLNNHSFNCIAKVAVTGNNLKEELRKLLNTVQYHHTLVDVFLCLSFASCLFTGELRLAIALLALWWGGYRNKPFIRQILCAVGLTVFEPPCRPNFRANHQNIITLRKG